MTTIRSYTELMRLHSLEERFEYLNLHGRVGIDTFGFERFLNQDFYRSAEWRRARREVIVRDRGCDLGMDGYEIHSGLYIHHMNPMTPDDIKLGNPDILNPEFLITVTLKTHNAIHFGDQNGLRKPFSERRPGDTKLW